ncbi:MAG: NUDIX domain-containing protein [Candidatus Diapherotrites archaeon]|uniref:NUDIX domain-containing protein n=1 Tax=Candidatus Iainarchaeum sp. TaxID=3101447 RepID=A0A8T3YNK2_9ARCH|nr:NUDIX domain-containing protein [Candidatus Diapherotrites archaeon]
MQARNTKSESEKLQYYNLKGELAGVEEKKKLHQKMREEYRKTGKVSIKHRHVRVLLMTTSGKVMLQQRSKWKSDNPGLWDKTIGGHVGLGDDYDVAVLKECAEELGIPATIVNKDRFEKTVQTANTSIIAILRILEVDENYVSNRISSDGSPWVEPNITAFYFGYYDGPVWFIDSESSGIQLFTVQELNDALKKKPEEFSEDIKYIVKKWGKLVKPLEKIGKTLND